ncbi:hypothetical protein [Arenimonas oryziterrae]|uniref:hypothetical protein n=1 Tax=Arenimonas oryziterrae TaxID=498055 RepID=UPI0012DCA519|nr:hypothetical protein [Arenimonas oryziterrae]
MRSNKVKSLHKSKGMLSLVTFEKSSMEQGGKCGPRPLAKAIFDGIHPPRQKTGLATGFVSFLH